MKDLFKTTLATLAMSAFVLSGCTDAPDASQFSEVSATDNEHPDEDAHAGHAHPSHGPHGGDLIELGNEEFHAELVHPHDHDDDAHHHDDGKDGHKVEGDHKSEKHVDDDHDHADHEHAGITVYILDGSAQNTVAIAAAEITLNLTHDGKPEQFKLAAMPDKGDPEGKSSRFASSDKELLEHFHEHDHVDGTLVLSIDGKSYRGALTHQHDDHGHAHGDAGHGGDHAH